MLTVITSKLNLSRDEFAVILISLFAVAVNLSLPENLSSTRAYLNDALWTIISLVTAIKCRMTALIYKGYQRKVWNTVALGCLFWFLGMLVWNYYEIIVGVSAPLPSFADLGYMLLAPSITLALIYLASKSLTVSAVLYQVFRIGVIFSALLVIHFLFFGTVIKGWAVSNIYLIAALSYPLLFFTALIHALTSPWYRYSVQIQNIVRFMFAGLLIHGLANAEYAYYLLEFGFYTSPYVDIAWTLGFVPFYLAAAYAERNKNQHTREKRKYFIWFSRYLNKIFIPLILIAVAVSIYSFRNLITDDVSDGVTILFVLFVFMLVSYTWLAEKKEQDFSAQLYEKDLILESLVEAVPYGIQENDLEGTIVYSNEAHHDIMAATPNSLIGRKIWDNAADEESQEHLRQRLRDIICSEPMPSHFTEWMRRDDGQLILLKVDWNYRYGPEGNLIGIVSVITDVTLQHANEEKLKQAATVFSSTTDGVIVTDKNGDIVAVNNAFTNISGFSESDVLGKNPRIFQSDRHTQEFYQFMWKNINENGYWNGEIWDRRKDGSIYPAWMSISSVKDDNGKIINYVSVFSDISHIKQSEEHLKFLAHHDPLTGLSNRTDLDIKIEKLIKRVQRNEQGFALFFIDLDQFKHINDSLGHSVGDQILVEVAKRLTSLARYEDVVSRLGGDEFVVLTEAVQEIHESVSVAERIIHQFDSPFFIEKLQLHVTPSIGIALYPENGRDAETLLKNADAAMYRAKLDGRNNFAYYSEELTTRAAERIKYENFLHQAVKKGEFLLHFQPQINIQKNHIHSVEALLRWQHPKEGMIPPEIFIPIAEESGVICEIGDWVLKESCLFMKQLLEQGIELDHISVNVSGFQFVRGQFVKRVAEILNETGLDANRLELEITESMIMNEKTKSIEALSALGELGISLAIDDFGTGYSSLSYLKKLPVNNIKIDRSFIRDIAIDKDDEAIVKSIIALGRTLNLDIIAEGVEEPKQLSFLQQADCYLVQGYLFSYPLSEVDIIDILREPAGILQKATRVSQS